LQASVRYLYRIILNADLNQLTSKATGLSTNIEIYLGNIRAIQKAVKVGYD